MSESWKVDPASKDYVMEGGSPVPTESLVVPAFYRLRIHRGRWMYAPNDEYGSDYFLVKKRFNGGDLSGLKNIGEKALRPMVDDKRAKKAVVTPDPQPQQSRSNSFLKIQIVDAQGEVEELGLPPIGGG